MCKRPWFALRPLIARMRGVERNGVLFSFASFPALWLFYERRRRRRTRNCGRLLACRRRRRRRARRRKVIYLGLVRWFVVPSQCADWMDFLAYWMFSHSPSLVHIRQSFVTCSRSNHHTRLNDSSPLPSIRLVFPHLPPSVCPVFAQCGAVSAWHIAFCLLLVICRRQGRESCGLSSSVVPPQFSSAALSVADATATATELGGGRGGGRLQIICKSCSSPLSSSVGPSRLVEVR